MYNKIMRYRIVFTHFGLLIFATTLLAKSVYANMCFPTFMADYLTIASAEGELIECGPSFIGIRYHFHNNISLKGDIPEYFTVLSNDDNRCSPDILENISPENFPLQLPPREEAVNFKQGRTYLLALYGTDKATEYLLYSCKGILAEGYDKFDFRLVIGIIKIMLFPILLSGFILGLNVTTQLASNFPFIMQNFKHLYIIIFIALIYYLTLIYFIVKITKKLKHKQHN